MGAYLDDWLGDGWTATPLRGDASTRSYYRVASDRRSWIVAFYPESIREQLRSFVNAFEAVRETGSVPEVVSHCDSAIGQFDAGDHTLSSIIRNDEAKGRELYLKAIEAIVRFQMAGEDAGRLNPAFDREKFSTELLLTSEYYFRKLSGLTDPALHRRLEDGFEKLIESLVRHPYVLCHRDYHGENIHVHDDRLYIIDYQDLRMGPDSYDLGSLLRDRGIVEVLGRDFEQKAIDRYIELRDLNAAFRVRYHEALLQRTIKTIGTFAMQAINRNRRHYLDYIPAALRTIRECAAEVSEYEPLAELFPMADD